VEVGLNLEGIQWVQDMLTEFGSFAFNIFEDLDNTQRRAAKLERVWSTSLMRNGWGSWDCSLEKKRLKEDLITLFNFWKEVATRWGSAFLPDNSDRIRVNGLKLCQRRFSLDIKENSFSERVVRHWKGCPGGSGVTIPGGAGELCRRGTEGRG